MCKQMLKKNSDICLHLEDEIASWGNKFGVIKMTGILSNFPKITGYMLHH